MNKQKEFPFAADYRKWQLPEKKMHHDPNMYQAPDAPFEGEPTYKSDYHKHPFAMRQSLRPDEGARGAQDPFDGRTGYRDDYIKHPMERMAPKEKECYKGPGAPLDGRSMASFIPYKKLKLLLYFR